PLPQTFPARRSADLVPSRIPPAVRRADEMGYCWLVGRAAFWGPALALPREHVLPMLRMLETVHKPYDQRLSVYLQRVGLLCYYTHPSLVDHADGPSLLSRDDQPRRAHKFAEPKFWDRRAIRI